MKAKIEIELLKVNGRKVDEAMSKNKRFKASTKKTISGLCEQIEKYFKDFKIKVKTDFKVE